MATLADYGPEVRAEVKQVREVVATLHEQLIKWNLVVWTAGNVSQRLHTADLMVIKPSGLRYEYLTPSSMVVCDLDGNVVDGAGQLPRVRPQLGGIVCRDRGVHGPQLIVVPDISVAPVPARPSARTRPLCHTGRVSKAAVQVSA